MTSHSDTPPNARDIIDRLGLEPHPEGGWYKETWRADAASDARATGTAIYYLLEAGDRSHWHRVDAAELWHFYGGAPLKLSISEDGEISKDVVLGSNFAEEQAPQRIVPAGWWQSAQSLGDWTLVGCTVSPGFEFQYFEMAPPNWAPKDA